MAQGFTKDQTQQDATSTSKGIVELATDAETRTGTDTARAVTPANITGIQSTVMVYNLADPAQTLTDETETRLNWDTETVDTRGEFALGTPGEFTAETDGQYCVIGQILFANIAVTTSMLFYLRIQIDTGGGYGSSVYLDRQRPYGNITHLMRLGGSVILDLNAGDKVALAAFHSRGSNLGLFADTSGHYHKFHIFKIH